MNLKATVDAALIQEQFHEISTDENNASREIKEDQTCAKTGTFNGNSKNRRRLELERGNNSSYKFQAK